MRLARLATLASILWLHACGGDTNEPVIDTPLPPPPVQLAFDAANYQGAVRNAFEWTDAAFLFAKLGADVADRMVMTSAVLPPLFGCPVSGAAQVTLTDRNRNGML